MTCVPWSYPEHCAQVRGEPCARKTRKPSEVGVSVGILPASIPGFGASSSVQWPRKGDKADEKSISWSHLNYSSLRVCFPGFSCQLTLSSRISLRAILRMAGSSSDSTKRLTATKFPVSRSRHLYTIPYDPSPSLESFSYRSILVLPRDL